MTRPIVLGIVMGRLVGGALAPAKTMRLPSIVCIPADEIGRIAARYE